MPRKQIRLHIEELVLRGVSEDDAPRVEAALRRELVRALEAGADVETALRHARSELQITVPSGLLPESIGQDVASQLLGGASPGGGEVCGDSGGLS